MADWRYRRIPTNYTLLELLLVFPNAPWNWNYISGSRLVPFKFIIDNLDNLKWDIRELLTRHDITTEIIETLIAKNKIDSSISFWHNIFFADKSGSLKLHPNTNVKVISYSEKLTMEIIEANIELEWNWYAISSNIKVVSRPFIEKYKNKDINWFFALRRGIIDFEFMHTNNIDFPQDMCLYISYNDAIKYCKRISYEKLSYSKKIRLFDVMANINEYWNWDELSSNLYIPWSDIEPTLSTLPWNIRKLSYRTDLTLDIVKRNQTVKWDWYAISGKSFTTMEIIESNMDLPWVWNNIGAMCKVSRDFIYKYANKGFAWTDIHNRCYDIDDEFIRAFQDKPLDWINLQQFDCVWEIIKTKNINWETMSIYVHPKRVLQYPDLPWTWKFLATNTPISYIPVEFRDWHELSCNSTITVSMVQQHYDQINWEWLSSNKFECSSLVEVWRKKRIIRFDLIRMLLLKLPLVRRHIFSTIYIHVQRLNCMNDRHIMDFYNSGMSLKAENKK